MKGQVSVEMLIVVGIGIMLVGIYALYGYISIDSYKKSNDQFLVKDSLEKIIETSKFVYLQGQPAKQQINICFPISIGNCSIFDNSISCYLRDGREIYQYSDVVIKGALPDKSGCWNVFIQAESDFVNISVS